MMDFIRNHANSLFVKFVFGVIIMVFIFYFGFNSMRNRSDSILAYVNDHPIFVAAFNRAYERSLNALRHSNIDTDESKKADFKRQILEQMVIEELLQEEANRWGLTVEDNEIRQEISKIPAFLDETGKFDLQLYLSTLRVDHMGAAAFEEEIKNMLMRHKLIDYVSIPAQATGPILEQATRDYFSFHNDKCRISYLLVPVAESTTMPIDDKQTVETYYMNHLHEFKLPARISIEYLEFTPKAIANTSAVTEEELRDFYENHVNTTYTRKERVKTKHILLIVEQNAISAAEAKVKTHIEAIRQRLIQGENFEKVASEISEDRSSSVNGGNLGWIERGQTMEPFEKSAFSLPINTLSEPVRTTLGWHLIMVENHDPEQRIPFDYAKGNIATTIAEERSSQQLPKLLDQAIERQLAGADLATIGKELGLPLNRQTDFSRNEVPVKFPGITTQATDTLFAMVPGNTTDTPLPIINGFLLATVVEVKPEEVLPLDLVRSDILHKLREETTLNQTRQTAQELLTAWQSDKGLPQSWSTQLKVSPAFSRYDTIQDLGKNTAIIEAAFAAQPGEWLPTVYTINNAACIARLIERLVPSEKHWDIEKTIWQQRVIQQRKRETIEAFLGSLLENAKFKLVSQKAIE